MDIKKLKVLLKKEEGTKLDFKLSLDLVNESGKKELAKDICAIANSKGGRGYIIVGIADKTKEIMGINREDYYLEERVQQIVASRCEPPIPISLDTMKIEDKKIVLITIYDSDQKPYQIKENGAFYIRRGSTTDVMRKQELLKLFEENLDLTIETCPVVKSKIDYLNNDLINKYFDRKGIYINKENKNFLLESTGIVSKGREDQKLRCTYGGLLVFSEINSICIPNNMIKIINKANSSIDEVNIIQGSLFTMIIKSQELIKKIMPKEYPVIAIYEALKNAVLYREYAESNRIIQIVITNKSIVIESPGDRIARNSNNRNEIYVRRNMWIYEKLITLDDKKVFFNDGRGFSRIKNSFKDISDGKVKFLNLPGENTFKVILPGVLHFK